jgi:hypothetical protein
MYNNNIIILYEYVARRGSDNEEIAASVSGYTYRANQRRSIFTAPNSQMDWNNTMPLLKVHI